MPFSSRPTLIPEDLIASRTLFLKIFQGLFHFTSLNFYFPDSPQSALHWTEGLSLDEFTGLTRDKPEGIRYDQSRKRLYYPLVSQGQSLGFLVLFGLSQELSTQEALLLDRLAGIALDMTALKKQVQLDPITGLYHEWAFRKRVVRVLKQWTKKEAGGDKKPEKLSLAENHPGETLILGILSLQPKPLGAEPHPSVPEREWKTWIREIREAFPPETTWASIDHHPLTLGFFCSLSREKGTPFLSQSALKALACAQECLVHLGWVVLDIHRQETFPGNPSIFFLMTRLWEQAETALGLAQAMGDSGSLNYHDILYQAGRVIDLLPGHRLVINIGQRAGVSPVMRFSIIGADPEAQEKGLIIPLDIQDGLSVAELIYLRDTGTAVQKNDRVQLASGPSGEVEESDHGVFSPQAPLHSFQSFQQKLRELLKSTETFVLAIGRVDDYAERLKLWGLRSVQEIQKEIYRLIDARMPSGGISGPYGRDGFILFFPGMNQPEARMRIDGFMDQIKGEINLSLSFAMADYPRSSFHKAEILDNALKALDHLSFLGPGSIVTFDAVSLNISGDKLYNLGDLKGAIGEYEKARSLDSNNINVLNSLGVCYALGGQLDRAIEIFLRILGLCPDDFMASFNLGFAYLRLGLWEKAVSLWEDLARRSDPPFDLAYHLGRLYRDRGDYAQAFSWFKKAEEASHKKGFIYRLLGECQESLGKRREAMGYFKKALKMNPQDALSLSHLGALYLQQGESLQVALSLCQQAARLEPAKGIFWVNLGKAFLLNQAPEKAVEALHQAMSLGEHSQEVYRLMGLAFRTLGIPSESRIYFIESLKRDPGNAEIQDYLRELEESPGENL
jgi:tetratricopeptide (TPR) repeat protein